MLKKMAKRIIKMEPLRLWLFLSILVSIFYVGLRFCPSSYSISLRSLGYESESPILGKGRSIRSDEWAVITPLHQMAVRNNFEVINKLSPYGESLLSAYILPLKHPASFFRPQVWAFFLVPADFAYSFEFFILSLCIFWGSALLLQYLNPRQNFHLLALLSLSLIFTGYLQFWLSTFGHIYMMWPFLTWFLLNEKLPWKYRLPGFTFSAVVILGGLYPPSTIALCFVSVVLWIATRDGKRMVKEAPYFGAVSIVLLCLWYFTFQDYISAILTTVYPGERSSSGGGVSPLIFSAHFIPGLLFSRYGSTALSNICENSTFASTFLFLSLGFLRPDGRGSRFFYVTLTGLFMMGLWIWFPIPEVVGKGLLWNKVPPTRMLASFGSLLFFTSATGLFNAKTVVTPKLWGIGIFLVLVLCSEPKLWHALRRPEIFVQLLVMIFLFYYLKKNQKASRPSSIIVAGLLVHLFLFFPFNPLQSSKAIFKDREESAKLKEIQKQVSNDPEKIYRGPGLPGAILSGRGIRSFSTVLTLPQYPFFRRMYPNMPEDTFHTTFGRYAHVGVDPNISQPEVRQADVIILPQKDVESFRVNHEPKN